MDDKTIRAALEKGLFYIYEAESQILEGLRLMSSKSSSSSLKEEIQRHKKETREQINRLEEVFDRLDIDYKKQETSTVQKALGKGKEILKDIAHIGDSYYAKGGVINSLLEQGKELVEQFKDETDLLDFALASGCQQIEQAEIAAYTLLRHFAQRLDEDEVDELLEKTVEEEQRMLQALSEISVNELMPKMNKKEKAESSR